MSYGFCCGFFRKCCPSSVPPAAAERTETSPLTPHCVSKAIDASPNMRRAEESGTARATLQASSLQSVDLGSPLYRPANS